MASTRSSTDTYWATFSINGKQSFIPLKVFKRVDAIRAAHRLAQKIEVGERDMTERKNIKLGEIVDAYLALLKGRGRAFKTMEKYTYVLKKLQTWWEKRGDKYAARFWVEDARQIEMKEDVVGLGSYGKTLTFLFNEDYLTDDDDESDEGDG